jgi:hypothetical protein
MPTMTNLHLLLPCALCSTRMAIPGEPICTICDAVTLPASVPDDAAALTGCPDAANGCSPNSVGPWDV